RVDLPASLVERPGGGVPVIGILAARLRGVGPVRRWDRAGRGVGVAFQDSRDDLAPVDGLRERPPYRRRIEVDRQLGRQVEEDGAEAERLQLADAQVLAPRQRAELR